MDFFNAATAIFYEDLDLVTLILLVSAGASVVFSSGFKLYTKIRPRFPIRVNCWFCNKNTEVKFSNRNSWDCPYCEQYNGFLQDGSYNKIIPAQSDEMLNYPVISAKRIPFKNSDNGLCRKCNINQELKIQQLASFTPIDSTHYDEEIELYRQRLDRAYQLCAECDSKMNKILKGIQNWLEEKYGSSKDAVHCSNNKHLWLRRLRQALVLLCDVLLVPISLVLVACLFARILPLVPIQIKAATRSTLMTCCAWEQCIVLAVGALHLISAITGQRTTATELIPTIFWALFILTSHETANLEAIFNLQYLAYLQLATMSVAQITSFWSRVRLFKKFKKSKLKKRSNNNLVKSSKKSQEDIPVFVNENTEDVTLAEQHDEIPTCDWSNDTMQPSEENKTSQYQLDPLELQSELKSLSLGPLNSFKPSTPPLFEPRTYSPFNYSSTDIYGRSSAFEDNFGGIFMPRKRKPVISPAKLQLNQFSHSSWVAGGYWHQNNMYPFSSMPSTSIYSSPSLYPFPTAPVSRSSSQSSGFVSNAGTNFSSLPNSRAGSVCDADRCSVLSEPIYPSYSPPLFCYLATSPPPGATLVFPTHTPVPPSKPPEHASDSLNNLGNSLNESSVKDSSSKSLMSVVKENLLLATLFFSSLMFNVIVVALAAINTFRSH